MPMAMFGSQESAAKKEGARQTLLGGRGIEEVSAGKERVRSAEEARRLTFNLLGAPGTYALPGTTTGGGTPTTPTSGGVYRTEGPEIDVDPAVMALSHTGVPAKILKFREEYDEKLAAGEDPNSPEMKKLKNFIDKKASTPYGAIADLQQSKREGILDPESFAGEMGKSAMFRMRSFMTREAEELLHEKGPAWERLNQAIHGSITEGAARAEREDLRAIRNQLAKGGTARRQGMKMAQEAMVRQKNNEIRTQQTWQSNLKLHEYIRKNANDVQEGNFRFLDNTPQLRQDYQNTMNALSDMMTQVALPQARDASMQAYNIEAAADQSVFWESLIWGGIGILAGAATQGMGMSIGTQGMAQAGQHAGVGGTQMPGNYGGGQSAKDTLLGGAARAGANWLGGLFTNREPAQGGTGPLLSHMGPETPESRVAAWSKA
jgi:hypothetical protein